MTYSSTLAINRSRFSGRNQNLIAVRPQERVLGPVSNSIVLIVLACLLGLLYLTQVTRTNAFGYQINGLQQTQASLVSQHNDLEVSSARLQSISRVQNSAVAKNMVAVAPSGSVQN